MKPIEKPQLKYLIRDCKTIINDHIIEHEMSVHGFAKLCGVHPNQLYLFLNGDRGLNLTTMEKIGKILTDKL
tara:strand:- start:19903 stop:20118 length:216 start_codon:yes stop_codon:yes gene_type:complete